VKSLRTKKEAAEQGTKLCCRHKRRHGLRHEQSGKVLPPHENPLEIGK